MKNLPLLYCGILFMIVAPWCGLIMGASAQLGRLQPEAMDENSPAYPRVMPGIAAQGRKVYTDLGCVACHTQQTRPQYAIFSLTRNLGGTEETLIISPDIARGWARRGTAANDYIFQDHVLLGDQRIGPDLTDFGSRSPKMHDDNWLLVHLYDPRVASPGSVMPSYRFLFETRKAGADLRKALKFPTGYANAPAAGDEIVPTDRASQLVAYLHSLKLDYELPDMPFPKAPEPESAPAAKPAAAAPAPTAAAPAAPAKP